MNTIFDFVSCFPQSIPYLDDTWGRVVEKPASPLLPLAPWGGPAPSHSPSPASPYRQTGNSAGLAQAPTVSKAFRDPPATHGPALTPIIHSAFCIIHDAGTCFASVAWGQRIPDFEPGELPFLNFPRSSFGIKAVKGIAEYNIRPTQGFHTLCHKLWTDHRFSHLQNGRIDFNSVHPSLSRGMHFL